MRNMRTAILLMAAALMAACVPSLQPLYTEKDVVFDPALLGTWVEKDGNKWVFSKSGDGVYEAVNTSAGKPPGDFEARLVQLAGYRFLDVYPAEREDQNSFYEFHLIPAHSISRIRLEGDSLRIAILDEDWLSKMIKEKKVAIAHERVGNRLLLTAPTAELQKLVVTYADDPKAFPDPEEFHREK